jgi:methylenetetrahydrofolate dehydrogenase (NADP+) / methenyltetrahydrofolate cyclohydrolase
VSAAVIDGKAFAATLRERVAAMVPAFEAAAGRKPGLTVVIVGEDPASQVYVRSKGKATEAAGMISTTHRLPETTTQDELIALVRALNADPAVDGILVQLPLPKHIDEQVVIATIDPDKDVDGFHVVNVGRLATGLHGFVPCTPWWSAAPTSWASRWRSCCWARAARSPSRTRAPGTCPRCAAARTSSSRRSGGRR